MFRRWTRLTALAALAALAAPTAAVFLLASAACLEIFAAPDDTPRRIASSEALGGDQRVITHVATDKPIYRPGETLRARGVMFDALSGKPLDPAATDMPMVEVVGPKGDTVANGATLVADSVASFAWPIPDDLAGGEYTLRLRHGWQGDAPAERKFDIRAYRAPRLKSQIVFVRDGYGPGDSVAASVHVERAEGSVPTGAAVRVTARVDGEVVHRSEATVDASGNAEARFALPAEIERGDGVLTFAIEDGGVVETAAKTIPILLQTLDIAFYPEGGDLVAGLAGRVYVEARTPNGKPADLAGRIVDDAGRVVADVRTEHEGRGRFALAPRAGASYRLVVVEPAGISRTFALPEVAASGTVLSTREDAAAAAGPLIVDVASTQRGKLALVLSKREHEIARLAIDGYEGGPIAFALTPPLDADGVLVATVVDEQGTPLAERLVFRKPARRVEVTVRADRASYVPGDTVTLTVETRDENGRPIESIVGLTATDDSVLEMVEKREQAPRLPVMALFESDVRELADAHVYLDSENPAAPRAVDLLLGTQGWRRYAFVDTAEFLRAHGDAARRVMALRVVTERDRELAGAADRRWFFRARFAAGEPRVVAAVPAGALAPGDAGAPDVAVGDPAAVPARGVDEDIDDAAGDDGAALAPEALFAWRKNVARGGERLAKLESAAALAGNKLADAAKAAEADAGEAKFLREDRAAEPASQTVLVREYAHALRDGRTPGDRVDFTETVFWHAGLRTTSATGQATVTFALSDAVTAFRVDADAFDARGGLGASSTLVESVEPFFAEPKAPLEVTVGDRVLLPIALVNGTTAALEGGTLRVIGSKGLVVGDDGASTFRIDAGGRVRALVPVDVRAVAPDGRIVVEVAAGSFSDRVTRELRVVPQGFPVELAQGGVVGPDLAVAWTLVIPDDVVLGSVRTRSAIYASPLASLSEALARLIQEPNGCFEQTSSTNYPLAMAQQYFQSHSGVDPQLIETSSKLLETGYRRLIGFECPEKGYEWFGADPGHEALTAYGLLEFTDMAKVTTVDAQMLARTREWLLACRDGEGNFARKRRALHTWIVDTDCSNGYILWSLLECGQPAQSLRREVAHFLESASVSKNAYVVALGALVASLADEGAVAAKLRARLGEAQAKDGFVGGATESIVGSRGDALEIETTALAILAWLDAREHAGRVESAMRWLAESCKAGRYGSTQSTVLALRAIVAYDQRRSRVTRAGSVQLVVDGHDFGAPVAFDASSQSALALPDFTEMLAPGSHRVELRMTGGSELPFSLAVSLHRTLPSSSAACALGIETSLGDATIAEGDATEIDVVVTNREDAVVPSPIAIVGLPGGLEPRHDQLKELVRAGRVAAYEVIGRDVVLYWRSLDAKQRIELPISAIAAVPGRYTGPASRAYLYYGDEHKDWAAPLAVEITPVAAR